MLATEKTSSIEAPSKHHVATVGSHHEDFDEILDRAPHLTTLVVGECPPPSSASRCLPSTSGCSRGSRSYWEILEDLAHGLGLETNHDVQDAVAAQLQRTAPAALKRIELDSDTEILCARAQARADIERVAEAVQSLLA
jgi:hypothetical protein